MSHITLRIERNTPSKVVQSYIVPWTEGLTLLNALRKISSEQDDTLAFRDSHCGRGVCTVCLMKLDGVPCKACCTPLDNGRTYTVQPANDNVIRDLVTEL